MYWNFVDIEHHLTIDFHCDHLVKHFGVLFVYLRPQILNLRGPLLQLVDGRSNWVIPLHKTVLSVVELLA